MSTIKYFYLLLPGQPLETPEVVAAKHAHFAAHAEVKANLHAASAGHAYGGGGFGGAYHGKPN